MRFDRIAPTLGTLQDAKARWRVALEGLTGGTCSGKRMEVRAGAALATVLCAALSFGGNG